MGSSFHRCKSTVINQLPSGSFTWQWRITIVFRENPGNHPKMSDFLLPIDDCRNETLSTTSNPWGRRRGTQHAVQRNGRLHRIDRQSLIPDAGTTTWYLPPTLSTNENLVMCSWYTQWWWKTTINVNPADLYWLVWYVPSWWIVDVFGVNIVWYWFIEYKEKG